MRTTRRTLLAAPLLLLGGVPAQASNLATPLNPPTPWPEVAASLPQASWSGSAQLRVFGLAIYQAQLWVGAGFRARDYGQFPLALSLTYQRRVSAQAMAERSLDEMQRQTPLRAAQEADWLAAMQALFVDVAANDRLTGVHLPEQGAHFWLNGRRLGEVADPLFSRRFFGIWLDTATSQPDLRVALLAAAPA
ncbi:MAG: hypothetical protein BWK72_10955 [Rhodoferax ferrireducens]|uniref:Chalcone isomerase domain-containing protein n=1 Tax=Rhodoferax ferrireducens TaxID=192843 RepID=A0A1W9KTK9_9BURK|nr:MAG: hypothetical protein BWK72_10955 [Rhodoferax ferrireducens]